MTRRAVYLDSLCFVELAIASKGSAKLSEGGKFVWPLQTLLRAGRDGQILVYTSIFTIAECVHADGSQDEEVQRLFRGLLTSGRGGVTPWQTDVFVLERARDLRWKHNINLKPIDSVHVATALEAKCDEFITWDGLRTRKRQSIMKATTGLAKLGLHVLTPDNTRSIPDDYRQHDLVESDDGQEEKK